MLNDKKKRKRWLLLLLVLLIGGAYVYIKSTRVIPEIVAGEFLPEETDATKMSEKERERLAQSKVDASQFTLSIYPEAHFKDGLSEGSIYIKNEPVNAYPISVVITDDATKEIIYESGAIQPGYEIKSAKLAKNLAAGTYQTTATVSIYDSETKEKKGVTQAAITVAVDA